MNTKSKTKIFLEGLAGGPLSIGELLLAISEGEGLSMSEFGEQLGISRSHMNDIEKGRKHVSPQKAAEYAKILGHSELQFIRLALQDMLNRNELDYTVDVTKGRKGA